MFLIDCVFEFSLLAGLRVDVLAQLVQFQLVWPGGRVFAKIARITHALVHRPYVQQELVVALTCVGALFARKVSNLFLLVFHGILRISG